MRRVFLFATLILGIGVAFLLWPTAPTPEARPDAPAAPGKTLVRPAAGDPSPTQRSATLGSGLSPAPSNSDAPGAAPPPWSEADFPIAAPLNAPDSTIARDLEVVQALFDAWRSNFPRDGNPVGENAEITAALMGANSLGLALIPQGHRAVNARGELCDRWGTPFRFHQLSGSQMEVRSAGPDRRFATDDDALWTPP
jgi:hypothetical protein